MKLKRTGWLGLVVVGMAFVAAVSSVRAQTAAGNDFFIAPANSNLAVLTSLLLTNDTAGASNPPGSLLEVSGVNATSTQGGTVALVPTTAWVNKVNGPTSQNDQAQSVRYDATGNILVAGVVRNGAALNDLVTIKYSPAGTGLWTNYFGSPSNANDTVPALAVDAAGNAYVAAQAGGAGTGIDIVALKYSAAGVPQWTNRFSVATNDDVPNAIALDPAGNIYLTGTSGFGTNNDVLTLKLDTNGTALWTNFFAGPAGDDRGTALAVDAAGNAYIAADSIGLTTSNDIVVFRLDAAGAPVWTNRYDGPGNSSDAPSTLVLDAQTNVIVAGRVGQTVGSDFVILKLTPAGAPVWTNTYNGPGNNLDESPFLALDRADNVHVTGRSTGVTNLDIAVLKYLADGTPVWTNRFNGAGDGGDEPRALGLDHAGNVYVAGLAFGGTNTDNDMVLIKLSAAGTPLWNTTVAGVSNGVDQCFSLAVDGAGNAVLVGFTANPPFGRDLTVARIVEQFNYTPPTNFTGADAFNYTITDSLGATAAGVVNLNVWFPVSVTSAPEGSIVFGGANAILSVNAAGTPPLTFQWFFNGAAIVAATNATYELGQFTLSNAGGYSLMISNTNGPVFITNVALTYFAFDVANLTAQLTLGGPTGAVYRIDSRDVLASNWQTFTNFTLTNNPVLILDPASPPLGERYYRAVQLP